MPFPKYGKSVRVSHREIISAAQEDEDFYKRKTCISVARNRQGKRDARYRIARE
jgi:hypothetical protein